jgi:prepilin-type N-terminal cleavage/methylation domain-containing protein
MRRAFTLPEVLLVLAVFGVLLALAIPSLTRTLDGVKVDAAASQLIAAHHRARMMAITRNQILVLSIGADEVAISPRESIGSVWSEAGPSGSGVVLAGPPRQFTFVPEGITLGLSNATLQLARGASQRTLVISRLGRIRLLH